MKSIGLNLSIYQIHALLKKDVLVRLRQPLMPIVQLVWPCLLFILMYSIRLKYGPVSIQDCQYPTRQLPTKGQILPFFQSYICSIGNRCMNVTPYEEYSSLADAPVTPIFGIAQLFINDDALYNAIVNLPIKANFITAGVTVGTSAHFNKLKGYIGQIVASIPRVESLFDSGFDIKQLFSDRKTFSKGGKLLCGFPFPTSDVLSLAKDILNSDDLSETNKDELEAMPTNYCKQLYLDISNTNQGKVTWTLVKAIIHGKILYSPVNNDTNSIIKHSNTTFEEIGRLQNLAQALDVTLQKLRNDTQFAAEFDKIVSLLETFLEGSPDDSSIIKTVMNAIRSDQTVYDVVHTVHNILECFHVDRFIGVKDEESLRMEAFNLHKKRLFYVAVHFNKTAGKDVTYNVHVDTDNTPVTSELRNRFWFPGASDSMTEDLKYHRGFLAVKHAVDMGIISHKKEAMMSLQPSKVNPMVPPILPIPATLTPAIPSIFTTPTTATTIMPLTTTTPTVRNGTIAGGERAISPLNDIALSDVSDWNLTDETDKIVNNNRTTSGNTTILRSRRSPQGWLESLLGLNTVADSQHKVETDDLQFYTKQFPYPAYTDDDFKTGLYLAQAIQAAFFLGLLAQVAASVRHRIWMRESRNTMMMRSMGLKPCSELIAWSITTFVELLVIFLAVCAIMYSGKMVQYTSFGLVILFLIIFGLCLISFCYMCATFFSSATIGSVGTCMFFLITFCPYIIVLIYDANISAFSKFFLNLSFTSAFAQAWSDIMRLELQETGLSFKILFEDGLSGDFGYAICMIVLDGIIYSIIGYIVEYCTDDDFRFYVVTREELASNLGAAMTNVSKIYNNNNIAVNNISVGFQRDQVTCLLGRNGAGKSTIIKLLTGQITQTTGRVILSHPNDTFLEEFDKVGVCSQDNILIPSLTAREHLEMYAMIKRLSNCRSEVDKTLQSMNFGKYENYAAWKLSGGYKRRLCVAIAFICSPNVVVLDEPCNGVDNKARRHIWDLINVLRKNRAVVFTTHFLDEAEFLSDSILIMKNGKVVATHSPQTMHSTFTENFDLEILCKDVLVAKDVKKLAVENLVKFTIAQRSPLELKFEISYDSQPNNYPQLLKSLEDLEKQGKIIDMSVKSKNLEQLFSEINSFPEDSNGVIKRQTLQHVDLKKSSPQLAISNTPLTNFGKAKLLFGKRCTHFKRDYRMLACALVLPAIFEIIAMWFVNFRLGDEFDTSLRLSTELYPDTTTILSMENPTNFTENIYGRLETDYQSPLCREFDYSEDAFQWILKTWPEYHEKRYGGWTFNETRTIVWYNNKGYHAMMGFLNDLNSHVLQAEMNDSDYKITSFNVPWKLDSTEFSTSSILQQVGDAGISFILLIAYSLIIAVASVYLVNERVKGEKLQQMLCGVTPSIYWGVAFTWDLLIMILGIVICAIIILAFGMPIYTERWNLWSICVLALLYGFACIPAVHVVEKAFSDASLAIVTIFCLNIIIPLITMSIVILIGIVGDSAAADSWRFFLNRLFLIFPQHALGDGLIEICKNHVVAGFFHRFDVDSYKNPIASGILMPHMCVLIILGVIFTTLNILIESGRLNLYLRKFTQKRIEKPYDDLKIVAIQNSLKRPEKASSLDRHVLTVDGVSKSFDGRQFAVRNVSFQVETGECFGLLGKNGAGKSTIFKMLSGEIMPTYGTIWYDDKDIAYCPQTNVLDPLLTVEEMMTFYGKLRRINDIPKLIENSMAAFQLENYMGVLVKNLSGGNQRKLNVAVTCFGWTSTVLMDEPTSDMDPLTRSIVYNTIDELLAEQRSIVLTSHSISEIEHICHRIAVMKEGQLITCSRPESLKMQYGGYYSIVVYCEGGNLSDVEKKIRSVFPTYTDFQYYTHSVHFLLKIRQPAQENGLQGTIPNDLTLNSNISLSELFKTMNKLCSENPCLRYTVNQCRLDTVFEKLLDSSDCIGGYVHNGYVETETAT